MLLDFLEQNHDSQKTAQEIAKAIADENISVSAVYRNLSELEAEGRIHKFTRAGVRDAYYQYIDSDSCREKLHLSCEKCGKTFHASENASAALLELLSDKDEFSIDKSNTILYGLCKNCRKENI